jgi:cellulose synthase/poly-beta-1,6-N-acetylglucosamine synthase-like glycosyltransferase
MPEFLFWFSLIFIVYTYAGYPVLLFVWSRLFPRPVRKAYLKPEPMVSVVIAARNEEKNIRPRIENLVQQEYPANKLEIIVVSDGSDDGTVPIVRSLIEELQRNPGLPSLKLIEVDDNKGKPYALNLGVGAAKGDYIVFADARQTYDGSAVSALVSNFSDSTVGSVSGELFLIDGARDGATVEMGVYWTYEKWIRKAESRIGSVVGATGAIYAIRRNLYQPLPEETLLDDVLTPLNIIMQGHRVVYEGRAKAYDHVSGNVQQEWRRKVRTLAGNWQLLKLCPLLSSVRGNPIWWRFMSHKILRLVVPFCLFIAFGSSILISGPIYRIATAFQITFYAAALATWLAPPFRSFKVLNVCYFFCVLNAAALAAFFKFTTGSTRRIWKSSENRFTTYE